MSLFSRTTNGIKKKIGVQTDSQIINNNIESINRKTNELKVSQSKISVDIELLNDLLQSIKKIYEVAENEIVQYKADDLSAKYSLSIVERDSSKYNPSINNNSRASLEKKVITILEKCKREFIKQVINSDRSNVEIKILLQKINRLINVYLDKGIFINSDIINSIEDIDRLTKKITQIKGTLEVDMVSKKAKISTYDLDRINIELSDKKRIADADEEYYRKKHL